MEVIALQDIFIKMLRSELTETELKGPVKDGIIFDVTPALSLYLIFAVRM